MKYDVCHIHVVKIIFRWFFQLMCEIRVLRYKTNSAFLSLRVPIGAASYMCSD